MKSVCFLVQHYYEDDNRVKRKAEALVAAGYSVDVLALRGSNKPKRYTLNGVNVCTISLGKKRGSLARYLFEYATFFAWSFWRLTLQMTRRRYVAVDVNTLPDFLIFAAASARWMGAKLILDMHEITPEFYMSKYGIAENSRWIRLMKYQERKSFDFADWVITINEPIQNLLVSRGLNPKKSIVIMNAADEARFDSLLASSSSAPGAAAHSTFVMIYHGTLTRLYGLDIAIEAFAMVHQEIPEAEIWILGRAPDAEPLKKLAEERGLSSKIKFVGWVPGDEIPAWLSKCDVGILPIRRDVFLDFASPNKLGEFIIMGKTVIISRLKAIRYYFSEDALAYFEPNDSADLAKQMVRLYRDRELRARLSARARKEYAPIRWDVMKHRYLELLGDITELKVAML
jgi:glycosyltransferase involved in cell wall biosynthesis